VISPDVIDTRRHTRYPVAGIYGSLRSPFDVRVINLSREGMALETAEPLQPGETQFVEVRHRGQNVSFEVSVRWCRRRGGDPDAASEALYHAGVSFLDMYPPRPGGFWDALQRALHTT
jgi:hypothetical protein